MRYNTVYPLDRFAYYINLYVLCLLLLYIDIVQIKLYEDAPVFILNVGRTVIHRRD